MDIIKGGSLGLGKNTALKQAESGVDGILTYRSSPESAAAVVAKIEQRHQRAVALPLDAADRRGFAAFAAGVKAVLEQHWQREHFDFLVNNAGIGINASLLETNEIGRAHV